MKFRGHETFYIRKGWLYKGLKNVSLDAEIFVSKSNNPIDVLGIGPNMVKSLRYWLQATGLTNENISGKRIQTLTPFGGTVFENDKFIEEIGTLSLIHYNLVKNKDLATSWFYFFNEFSLSEFTKEDYLENIVNYIIQSGSKVPSLRSLEDDFNCIINTYLSKNNTDSAKESPENNIDSPLGELNLIMLIDKKKKIYKKNQINKDLLDPYIALAIISNESNNKKEINISSLQFDKCNIGKVFNLDSIFIAELLSDIEQIGEIKVVRTAGLDILRFNKDLNYEMYIEKYYETINA